MTVEELVEGTTSYLAEGYRAVKLRAGGRAVEEDLARIAAVGAAAGDEVRLMVDLNERLGYGDALWPGRGLRELGVYWLEEPLRAHDLAGHRRLAAKLDLAIAVGEHLHGASSSRPTSARRRRPSSCRTLRSWAA